MTAPSFGTWHTVNNGASTAAIIPATGTWSVVVPTGAKMALLLLVATRRNNTSPGVVTSATWTRAGTEYSRGPVAFTKITGAQTSAFESSPANQYLNVEAWIIFSAQAGTGDIVVNLDQAVGKACAVAIPIKECSQVAPSGSAISLSTTSVDGSTLSVTPTNPSTNATCIGFFAIPDGTSSMTAGTGTERTDDNTGAGSANLHAQAISLVAASTGAQTITSNFSIAVTQAVGIGLAFNEAKPAHVVNPWVSGSPVVGETLSANDGQVEIADAQNTFVRKFYRDTSATLLATASTYVLQPVDDGHQILIGVTPTSVDFTATGSETFSALYPPGATVVASGTTSCTIVDPPTGKVFQRTLTSGLGGATGSVPISGKYTGSTTPTRVACRVTKAGAVAVTWVDLVAPTISGGNITGTVLNVPVGDGYIFEMITYNGSTQLATATGINTWGVGVVILWLGSSTPEKAFTMYTGLNTTTVSSRLRMYDLEGGWRPLSGGAGAISCGNDILTQLDVIYPGSTVPIGFIGTANGGTKLRTAGGIGWFDRTQVEYQAMLTTVSGATSTLNLIEAVFSKIDSLAVGGTLPASGASEKADTDTLHGNLRSDYGANLRIYLTINPGLPNFSAADDQYVSFARHGQSLAADVALTYAPLNGLSILSGPDGVHPTAVEQAREWRWMSRAFNANQLSLAKPWRGPRPSTTVSDTYTPGTKAYVVTFDRYGGSKIMGKTGDTGLTGFEISGDSGVTWTEPITSAVITSATGNTVTITTTNTLVTALTRMRYLYGHDPNWTNCVCDNSEDPQ